MKLTLIFGCDECSGLRAGKIIHVFAHLNTYLLALSVFT